MDWPRDENGKRTDPIGRFLESLPEDERRLWGSTCTEDVAEAQRRLMARRAATREASRGTL